MHNGPATQWATSPASCSAVGRAAASPLYPSSTPTKSGPESNTRSLRTSSREGYVDEGLTIVKALRSRYDGRTRNPWNEYECGNWYARAMSSYALLGALSGFRYSAVEQTLHFGPKLKVHPFSSFFSTASGYGTITLDGHTVTVTMIEGELAIQKLQFTDADGTRSLEWKATARPNAAATKSL